MVRFNSEQNKPSAPDYFRRSVQYRLLMIVFSLMLVVILITEAAKPSNWTWLTSAQSEATEADSNSSDQLAEDPMIDTRLEPKAANPPGVFTFEPTIPPSDPETQSQFPLGVDPARFESIKDDTPFKSSESDLWYDTLVSLRNASPGEFAKVSYIPAGFTQLYRQPDLYRGRPVQINGLVKRAQVVQARKNEQGITEYWQCWLFPPGTSNPIVIYSLEMPERFPQGMSVNETVTFNGIFFKRWAYPAKGGVMAAPLVLARRGQWTAEPVAQPLVMPNATMITLASLCLAALAIIISLAVYRRSQHVGDATRAYRERRSAASPVRRLESANIEHPVEQATRAMEQLDRGDA